MENITAKYIKVRAAHSIVVKSKKSQKPHKCNQQAEVKNNLSEGEVERSSNPPGQLLVENERIKRHLSRMKLALKAMSQDLTCTCNINRTRVDMGSTITHTLVFLNLRSPKWVHSQAT